MANLTVAWMALQFCVGFIIYLLPKCSRFLALGVALLSVNYALIIFADPSFLLEIKLLDSFGVTLTIDQIGGFFIITNALVTTAVIF